ncbi:MAG TPA: hypothetical protein VES73_12220 [Lamprocystis sp. (in: g-proteobacteria)]|nr:hypothetical protein [Lamprocystis sp. (in: g-proteobacteria)]
MTLTQCYRSLNAPLLLVALTAAAVGLAPNHAAGAADLANMEAEHLVWAEEHARWGAENADAETGHSAAEAAAYKLLWLISRHRSEIAAAATEMRAHGEAITAHEKALAADTDRVALDAQHAQMAVEHAAQAATHARDADLHGKIAAIVGQIEALPPTAPGQSSADGPAIHPAGSPPTGQ